MTYGFSANGLLKQINDNLAAAEAAGVNLRIAKFEFDVALNDSSGVSNKTIAAHGVGVSLPAHAIVCGGFVDVNTLFTSLNANNGTIAIKVVGANDIISATAVSGAPYSSIGRKAIVPKFNTPESTSVKTTAVSEITVTVATSGLTAGTLTGYLYYVEGVASA